MIAVAPDHMYSHFSALGSSRIWVQGGGNGREHLKDYCPVLLTASRQEKMWHENLQMDSN